MAYQGRRFVTVYPSVEQAACPETLQPLLPNPEFFQSTVQTVTAACHNAKTEYTLFIKRLVGSFFALLVFEIMVIVNAYEIIYYFAFAPLFTVVLAVSFFKRVNMSGRRILDCCQTATADCSGTGVTWTMVPMNQSILLQYIARNVTVSMQVDWPADGTAAAAPSFCQYCGARLGPSGGCVCRNTGIGTGADTPKILVGPGSTAPAVITPAVAPVSMYAFGGRPGPGSDVQDQDQDQDQDRRGSGIAKANKGGGPSVPSPSPVPVSSTSYQAPQSQSTHSVPVLPASDPYQYQHQYPMYAGSAVGVAPPAYGDVGGSGSRTGPKSLGD